MVWHAVAALVSVAVDAGRQVGSHLVCDRFHQLRELICLENFALDGRQIYPSVTLFLLLLVAFLTTILQDAG